MQARLREGVVVIGKNALTRESCSLLCDEIKMERLRCETRKIEKGGGIWNKIARDGERSEIWLRECESIEGERWRQE